jgi:peptidylprolyl isomerase
MKTVINGNNVKLHYKGTFHDGEIFDDSRYRVDPLEVLVGSGRFLNAFESALIGMTEGEVKTITLTPEQAYGPVNPEATMTFAKSNFPDSYEFEIGHPVRGVSPDGQQVLAKIVSFTDDEVMLDMNHPLAGKDLNFEIELVEIDEATTKETISEE